MELHPFNPRIRQEFGETIDGRPKFRIARRMMEKRLRNHEDNPFIHEVVDMKKYSYVPDDIWILEKLIMGESNPELIEPEKGTYEPVYVFWWDSSGPKDFSYKEPEWFAVEFLIKVCVEGPKATREEMQAEADADFARRRAICRDVIEESSPWIPSSVKEGHGIFVPSNYKKD